MTEPHALIERLTKLVSMPVIDETPLDAYGRCDDATYGDLRALRAQAPAPSGAIKSQDLRFGPWRIAYDPPPIPIRSCDWHYTHDDDDGECASRSGHAATLQACLDEIHELMADASPDISKDDRSALARAHAQLRARTQAATGGASDYVVLDRDHAKAVLSALNNFIPPMVAPNS